MNHWRKHRIESSVNVTWRSVILRPLVFMGWLCLNLPSSLAQEELDEADIVASDREHWSFRTLERPEIPHTKNESWSQNAIDCFILAKLEQHQRAPSAKAEHRALVRRIFFDLVGLPPSPQETSSYLREPNSVALSILIDKLIASPRFGERWAQHWLDVARFAETDGFEHDKVRKNAWKYRDWVIGAVNADLPFDQFVRYQIAGDLIDDQFKTATAFCLSGPDMPDINLQDERKHTLLNEMTATVGSAFLGLQVGCAQCHNHMFDPISQADFYRLRAFFNSSVKVKKNESVSTLVLDPNFEEIDHLMIRGEFRRRGARLRPAFLRIANSFNAQLHRNRPARLQLADWIVNPNNPLTARVIVNRLWHHHFGRGLSTTPSDFGVMGDEPTHPQLLDWLACELIESGWQMKHIHRLIVNSATYQQQSRMTPVEQRLETPSRFDEGSADLYAFFPRRRLDAEVVRDAMLVIGGTLNYEMGGPGVRPPLPKEMTSTLLKNQWNPSARIADHHRRSIYVFARRNLRYPLFATFDRPSANCTCDQRHTSTTPPQSLMMMNSGFSLEVARRFAGFILLNRDSTADRMELLFESAYGRLPSRRELEIIRRFLAEQVELLCAENRATSSLALPFHIEKKLDVSKDELFEAAAWTDLCLTILNSNEFVYLD